MNEPRDTKDQRLSRILSLGIGIFTTLVVAGIIAMCTMQLAMREQLIILINKPEPATKEQLTYTNARIDSMQLQANQLQAKMEQLQTKMEQRK